MSTQYVIRTGDAPHYTYWTAIVGRAPASCKMWTTELRRAKHYATQARAEQAMLRSRFPLKQFAIVPVTV